MTQSTIDRHVRWGLLAVPLTGAMILSGCTGAGEGGNTSSADPAMSGFTLMVPQANDVDDPYAKLAEQYSEETGVEIEVLSYPSENYNQQLTTQLQAGNAADLMVLIPGGGQAVTVQTIAEGGFLEPLGEASAAIIPSGQSDLFGVDGTIYGQPTALAPTVLVWNGPGGEEVGIDDYPATFEEMIDDCAAAREGGKSFVVVAGAISFNTGLLASIISATRVYQGDPDWNQQRSAGAVTFADSGWRNVLEDIVTMNDAGCFQDGAAGGTFDSITQGLGGQTALSAPVPGSAAAQISANAGVDLNAQAFPPAAGQEPYALVSASYAWSINAAAEDDAKASAQAFLDWAAEPAQAQTFADLSGLVAISGVTTDNVAPEYEPIADLIEAGDYTGFPVESWPNPAVYDALSVGIQGLFTGQRTVDQILDEMDTAWDTGS
ncbi:ABC transporter substrate-binding protein [Microbacterium aurantiacum]|uniref:ABC transporter substrate-binding protein n=1 Tax=Microbacterium aurantiacum TaxID=162393 RepID=A0AAJ2LY49_9MICO|nr:ABC transporter substrate-binding protein [Microbacterium aurantiacum]MDS0245053.1 ABC transporter substrate-binding protein [Microbacterium aurantiacum]